VGIVIEQVKYVVSPDGHDVALVELEDGTWAVVQFDDDPEGPAKILGVYESQLLGNTKLDMVKAGS
jgi:hypothetical protein